MDKSQTKSWRGKLMGGNSSPSHDSFQASLIKGLHANTKDYEVVRIIDSVLKNSYPDHYLEFLFCESIELEYVVKNGNFIIGFIDALVSIMVMMRGHEHTEKECNSYYCSEKNNPSHWKPCEMKARFKLGIEYKPKIDSFGDLMRQMKTYMECMGDKVEKWIVVTMYKPDENIIDMIKSQGIGFEWRFDE